MIKTLYVNPQNFWNMVEGTNFWLACWCDARPTKPTCRRRYPPCIGYKHFRTLTLGWAEIFAGKGVTEFNRHVEHQRTTAREFQNRWYPTIATLRTRLLAAARPRCTRILAKAERYLALSFVQFRLTPLKPLNNTTPKCMGRLPSARRRCPSRRLATRNVDGKPLPYVRPIFRLPFHLPEAKARLWICRCPFIMDQLSSCCCALGLGDDAADQIPAGRVVIKPKKNASPPAWHPTLRQVGTTGNSSLQGNASKSLKVTPEKAACSSLVRRLSSSPTAHSSHCWARRRAHRLLYRWWSGWCTNASRARFCSVRSRAGTVTHRVERKPGKGRRRSLPQQIRPNLQQLHLHGGGWCRLRHMSLSAGQVLATQ